MKTMFTALAVLLAGSFARAAITSDFDCETKDGVNVHFEAQVGIFDDEGNVTGEKLYRNTVWIDVNGAETRFEPDHSIVSGSSAILGAWKTDGQFVIVNAIHKSKDEGETRTFEGEIELNVRSKNGTIERKEGTKVTCKNYGEA